MWLQVPILCLRKKGSNSANHLFEPFSNFKNGGMFASEVKGHFLDFSVLSKVIQNSLNSAIYFFALSIKVLSICHIFIKKCYISR